VLFVREIEARKTVNLAAVLAAATFRQAVEPTAFGV
jgi:hypothetical protein